MAKLIARKTRREAVAAFIDALDLFCTPEQARKYVALDFGLTDQEVEAVEQEGSRRWGLTAPRTAPR